MHPARFGCRAARCRCVRPHITSSPLATMLYPRRQNIGGCRARHGANADEIDDLQQLLTRLTDGLSVVGGETVISRVGGKGRA